MAKRKKMPSAVELGSLGGKARAKSTTKERRSEIARMGAAAYWEKYPEGDPKRRKRKKKKKRGVKRRDR
jgi:hypothetical protein